MGKSPAVLIVVRHGARLDAADKQWHLTSPTPYDPPLSYGGWVQSRALGARIAGLLRSREMDDFTIDDKSGTSERSRKHKVVIHSSPFLRCVQTSIAISAGLAQNPGHSLSRRPTSPHSAHYSPHASRVPSSLSIDTSNLQSSESRNSRAQTGKAAEDSNLKKSLLRVDAFLGEWLSPDYFELITPPPSSIMMVAGAKADLLRREDYDNLIHVADIAPASTQGFPGGWSPASALDSNPDGAGLSTMSSLGQALPRSRTSSLGSRHSAQTTRISTTMGSEHGVYQPPVPSYAISNSASIPPGYVAHARDACTTVDYQWDSMREPQNWGDGGEYGEEWSSMHKRFRKGLHEMVRWYRESDDLTGLQKRLAGKDLLRVDGQGDEEEDDDVDLVVILVTHGAGCNALIGALTNQPVLLDVGMASLTMAVRKPSPKSTPGNTPRSHSRSSSVNLMIHDEYDVKLVANMDHLRPSQANSLSSSRNTSVTSLSNNTRARYSPNGSSSVDGIMFTEGGRGSISSAYGSIRRTATVTSTPMSRHNNQSNHGSRAPATESFGLWTPRAAAEPEPEPDHPDDDILLNFGDAASDVPAPPKEDAQTSPLSLPVTGDSTTLQDITDFQEQSEEDQLAPLGLWGSPRPPGEAERIREIGVPKRRWTISEKGVAS